MTFPVFRSSFGAFTLTTDHAAASYGAPVLICQYDGWSHILGPGDQIPVGDPGWNARDLVGLWSRAIGRTAEERTFARAFIESAPTAAREVVA